MPTFGSLFSGLGAFDLGLERAGWRCAWQYEIDPQCRRVLRHHWPDMIIYDKVETLNGATVAVPDLIVGGSPCTDFSLAGKRAGLSGKRSGLWWQFHRLIGEIRPRWVLVENVSGLRSSWSSVEPPSEPVEGSEWEVEESNDLETILASLGELGYWWAFCSLDARYRHLAQRRERIFIVGRSGDSRGVAGEASRQDAGRLRGLPAKVLLESSSMPWHPPPGRRTQSSIASDAGQSADGCSVFQAHGAAAKRCGSVSLAASDDNGTNQIVVGPAVSVMGEHAHTLTSKGADAGEDGSGRGTPIVAYQCHGTNVGPMGTLRRGNGNEAGGMPFVVHGTQDPIVSENLALPLEVNSSASVIAFQERGRDGGRVIDVSGDLSYTLLSPAGGGRAQERNIATWNIVRKLSPTECLRLQGLPDTWMDLEPPLSDSAKYRMIGNAGAVTILEWIGRRINAVEKEV